MGVSGFPETLYPVPLSTAGKSGYRVKEKQKKQLNSRFFYFDL